VSLKEKLSAEVKTTFRLKWEEEKALVIPAPSTLRLNSNHAKDLEKATVLYADLDGSTNMVDNYYWWFSAEVYKAFLRCTSQLIRSEGGTITAYDGDRVMAIFTGDERNTRAVRCALSINYAVEHIIKPAIQEQYTTSTFQLKHVVGIDSSQLRAARIGVHGDNDIVWIGRAANYAAKLTNLSGMPTWITKAVYDDLKSEVKFLNGIDMWQLKFWTDMNNMSIYCSNYWHSFL
jgi:class 3 adenylate cyclase